MGDHGIQVGLRAFDITGVQPCVGAVFAQQIVVGMQRDGLRPVVLGALQIVHQHTDLRAAIEDPFAVRVQFQRAVHVGKRLGVLAQAREQCCTLHVRIGEGYVLLNGVCVVQQRLLAVAHAQLHIALLDQLDRLQAIVDLGARERSRGEQKRKRAVPNEGWATHGDHTLAV